MDPLTVMIVIACLLLLMLVPTGWAFIGTNSKTDRWIYIAIVIGSLAVLSFVTYMSWDQIQPYWENLQRYFAFYFQWQEMKDNIREMMATPGPTT